MNFETARNNMIASQVRAWDVNDPRVLEAMQAVPREEFVQVSQRKLAFADLALPLGHDQFMMKPVVEGRALQAAAIQPNETVLEVGTGSGYLTALLAHLGKTVDSIDIYEDFVQQAEQRLHKQGIDNVQLTQADIFDYLPKRQYDAIVLTGSVSQRPDFLTDWITPGGRVFAVVGEPPVMQAQLLRVQNGQIHTTPVFETLLPKLVEPASRSDFQL